LIASDAVGPSDGEKVARHQGPPCSSVMWDRRVAVQERFGRSNLTESGNGRPKAQFGELANNLFVPVQKQPGRVSS
jgi:hypothetical protein